MRIFFSGAIHWSFIKVQNILIWLKWGHELVTVTDYQNINEYMRFFSLSFTSFRSKFGKSKKKSWIWLKIHNYGLDMKDIKTSILKGFSNLQQFFFAYWFLRTFWKRRGVGLGVFETALSQAKIKKKNIQKEKNSRYVHMSKTTTIFKHSFFKEFT